MLDAAEQVLQLLEKLIRQISIDVHAIACHNAFA